VPTDAEPLVGRSRTELEALLAACGQPRYRGGQVADWLYRHGAHDCAAMTSLPAEVRATLAAEYGVGRSELVASRRARDGTTKLLLALADGARIETVALPSPDRLSVCVSTQTGCAVGCTFCATGALGAGRNLTVGELTDQVLTAGEQLGRRVSHAVFMGMGEPLLNLDAVLAAIRLWRDELDISPRRVTVSTVGIVPRIADLGMADLPVTLAVSLHAADDALRARLIPSVARRWSVSELFGASRHYAHETGRRVTYEVVLLAGVNDRAEDAVQLARWVMPGEHVNLIPYNPTGAGPFQRPGREAVTAFRRTLEAVGAAVTQRRTRGAEIAGACGQLRADAEVDRRAASPRRRRQSTSQ
jgi:23S rRNA (adenine2503-C2)-methyltransferase